jgi:hypothetical protein
MPHNDIPSNACHDFWHRNPGALFQKQPSMQNKRQASKTNKPVAIATRKSFEN